MTKHNGFLSFIFAALFLAGCNNTSNVAIIDLDKIAEETGYGLEIKTKLEQLQSNFNNQLGQLEGSLKTKLEESQSKMGKKLTKEQRLELNTQMAQARQQLQKAQREASGKLKQQQASFVTQLHDLVRPVAKSIANEKGMDIVMIRNKTVLLDYTPKVDITDEVIQALLKQKAEKKAAEPATEKKE